MNSTGDVQWFWTSKLNGDDAANAVGEISSDEVIVVGWSTPAGGIGKRSIWKLNLATGQEVWQASFDSPNAAQTSAYENLEIASNDKSAYFTGFVNKASLDEMFFKSYGNVVEGTAIVERMSLEKLQGAQKPSSPFGQSLNSIRLNSLYAKAQRHMYSILCCMAWRPTTSRYLPRMVSLP